MANKEIVVKKYVVKLNAEGRERLEALIYAGKSSAQMLTKARKPRQTITRNERVGRAADLQTRPHPKPCRGSR